MNPLRVALVACLVGCAPASEGAASEPRGASGHWPASPQPSPQDTSPDLQPVRPVGTVELDPIELSPPEHRLARLDESGLATLVRDRSSELGSVSFGVPNRGRLLNAVPLPESPLWHIEETEHAWGTRETIESIERAIQRVESDHPGSPPLHIGHISRKQGGWLRPHRSHQSGRDVDLGYYYLDGPRWYAPATADNLDRARTWSLLMGLLTQGNVEYIFITRDVQSLLLEYARGEGIEEGWLVGLFDSTAQPRTPRGRPPPKARPGRAQPHGKGVIKKAGAIPDWTPEPIVRHRFGHHTHLHVRFYSDMACETGRRTFSLLRRHGKL